MREVDGERESKSEVNGEEREREIDGEAIAGELRLLYEILNSSNLTLKSKI